VKGGIPVRAHESFPIRVDQKLNRSPVVPSAYEGDGFVFVERDREIVQRSVHVLIAFFN